MSAGYYRLFLYGPLSDARVLSSVVGREVTMSSALLPGYKRKSVSSDSRSFPSVEVSDATAVRGSTFQATPQDLAAIDIWQGPYSRFLALLGDHQPAWVYYYAPPDEGRASPTSESDTLVKQAATAQRELRPRTGPEAVAAALAELDMDAIEKNAFEALQSGRKTARPEAIKKLKILQGLRRNKLKPGDMVWDSLPVVPPAFRPYAVMGDMLLAGDVNELYQDVFSLSKAYQQLESVSGKESTALKELKPQLYGAVRAATGFGPAVTAKGKERNLQGFMAKVLGGGKGPKYAFTTRKLLSKPQDFVGRAVIGVDPELTIDEVGVPEDMAWKLFSLPGQRRMVQSGVPAAQAILEWNEKSDRARKALAAEAAERPVLYSRAPVWHQQGILAGMAKIIPGDQMMINPVTSTGLGADFDGDLQIGKVFVTLPLNQKSNAGKNIPILASAQQLADAKGGNMFKNACIPSFDPRYRALYLVDLEDFPKGEYSNTNPNGTNGPIHFYHAIPGTQVVAYDEESKGPVWADVHFVSEHPSREIEIVTLSNRKQIITDNDPRAVYGIAPGSSELRLERFTPSEALAKKVSVPVVESVSPLTGDGDITHVEIVQKEDCVFRSLPLDFSFGYFCGAIAGNGWWDKRDFSSLHPHSPRSIYVSDLEDHVFNTLDGWIQKYLIADGKSFNSDNKFLNSDNPDRNEDTHHYSWNFKHSDALARWLDIYICGGLAENTAGSGNKKLPDFMARSPLEFREGLFVGLMDTAGSVSISQGKKDMQLTASTTSTSLRLLRDMQWLGNALGVRGTISSLTPTPKGNTSWIITWNAADLKKQGFLSRLAADSKRSAFEKGNPSDGPGQVLADNKVVLPQAVYEDLKRYIASPKITKEMRQAGGPEFEEKSRQKNLCLQLREASKVHLISRPAARKLLREIRNIKVNNLRDYDTAIRLLDGCVRSGKTLECLETEQISLLRKVIQDCAPLSSDKEIYKDWQKAYVNLSYSLKTCNISVTTSAIVLDFISVHPPKDPCTTRLVQWEQIVENENIVWSSVESVEKTGQKETGYDLTVPGYETFMNADGVILSNTMNVHALLTPEAVKDAREKLFPSKQLFSIRDQQRTLPEPKQDIVLGLYTSQVIPSRKQGTYGDPEAAMKDLKSGKLDWSDTVEIPDGTIPGL